MYWFRRPPYLRWAAAALILIAAAAVELRPRPTMEHPFAVQSLAAGDALEAGHIEWRPIPAGLLPPPDLSGGIVTRAVASGSPLLPGDVSVAGPIPGDWWSVPMEIPPAAPGTAVRIVLVPTGATVDGVVVAPPDDDPFQVSPVGLVAVPGDAASAVAAAVARHEVIVLLGRSAVTGSGPGPGRGS